MFMEHDLGLWVCKEYGRRFKDRVKKKAKDDRGVFEDASEDREAYRYLEDKDTFNFPA